MQLALPVLAMSVVAAFATAQNPDGSAPRPAAEDPRVLLEYGQFDPTVNTPALPPGLQADASVNLHIVQFKSTPTEADRDAVRQAGGVIKGYLPVDCHLVYMPSGAMGLYAIESVRWVGAYEPAYRLEPFLLKEITTGVAQPTRIYNMVMVDKRNDKARLAQKLQAIGAEIIDQHIGGLLFTASLNAQQLRQAAAFDEVLWIDRFSEPEYDMDNARVQGGADTIEAVAGYTGQGIIGHVYEGVEGTHPDFNTPMLQVGPGTCSGAASHGHCTAGIVFGNGTSAPQARGMAPDAVGFFTRYISSTNTTCATSPARNTIIGNAIANQNIMFTTASWGNARTFFYTSDSADADDIVFDHRIPWTQSQSNAGNQDSRPQAWGKNIISVGGVFHGNNSSAADDSWGGGGSTGPAQDTRSKPDLAAYYDNVWTSDRTGASGYSSGNSTTGFNGTSAATPIVAGHNALAIQMYTDNLFTPPRVPGGSRFENRPYAQTLKALQIACANMYTPTATNNRREHVGYGFPSLSNMYERRDKISVIPEDVPIQQGQTHTYTFNVNPGESILKICMTYLDPAGNPAASFDRINDLDLRVVAPNGTSYWGNRGLDGTGQTNQSASGGFRDTRDTVENVIRNNPQAGDWTVIITAPTLTVDANTATGATDATYALVVNGGRRVYGSDCARYLPDNSTTSNSGNYFPFGGYTPSTVDTVYATNNSGAVGGAVYFDVTTTTPVWIHSIMVNTSIAAGEDLCLDLYTKSGSYVGSETNAAAWTARSAGKGVSAGQDNESQIDLAQPFRLSAGTHAFAIAASNFEHRYTNGANTYGTTVQISTGAASNIPFTGPTFTPRTANISLKWRSATSIAQNMRYQTVLRSDELGGAGSITGLAFSAKGTGTHYNSNLLVRMAHRPAGYQLSTNYNTNITGSTTVLSANNHTFHTQANQWRNIGFSSAFNYDGTSDVVVELICRGNVQTTTGNPSGLFNIDDAGRQRMYAGNWDLSTPTTGTVATTGAMRMRAEFSCANANEYGSTCGKLEAAHSGSSQLGSTFTFRVNDAPANFVAFVGLGTNKNFPYPISLTPLGFTNCLAFSQSIATLTANTNASGTATYSIAIPNNTVFNGYKMHGQWLTLDTSEPGDLTFSNFTTMTVGSNP